MQQHDKYNEMLYRCTIRIYNKFKPILNVKEIKIN